MDSIYTDSRPTKFSKEVAFLRRHCTALSGILCCFILLGFTGNAFAQTQISFKQLSIEQGLSQNSAISITQDSIGYLWVATQDGLNKYDGNHFTKYPYGFVDITKPNYSRLGKVYTDRQGQVWCIPIGKIVLKFNRALNRFDTITHLKDATTIFQATDNRYYIGTYSKGLYQYDTAKDTAISVLTVDNTGVIYDIKQDKNTLLLATDSGIVSINAADNKLLNTYNKTLTTDSIPRKFSSIAIDRKGTQWFGTFGGGLFFKKGKRSVLDTGIRNGICFYTAR